VKSSTLKIKFQPKEKKLENTKTNREPTKNQAEERPSFKWKYISAIVFIFIASLVGLAIFLVSSVLRNFWIVIWTHISLPIINPLFSWTQDCPWFFWLSLKPLAEGPLSWLWAWVFTLVIALPIGQVLNWEGGERILKHIPVLSWFIEIIRSLRDLKRAKILFARSPLTGQIARAFSSHPFTFWAPDKKEKTTVRELGFPLAPNPTSGFAAQDLEEETIHTDCSSTDFLSKTVSFTMLGRNEAVCNTQKDFEKVKEILSSKILTESKIRKIIREELKAILDESKKS